MKLVKSSLALLLGAALVTSVVPGLTFVSSAANTAGSVSKPKVNSKHTVTWDCIYFGNYWQEDTNGDGKANENDSKQAIKWRVLSVNGNDAFIMSEKCLDHQKYHEGNGAITWENCTLRKWLNETFYNNAFSAAEQAAIQTTTVLHDNDPYKGTNGGNDTQDKVYLPSLKEVTTAEYGFDVAALDESKTRYALPTTYTVGTKVIVASMNDPYSWWTRTPGRNGNYVRMIDRGAAGNAANQGGHWCYDRGGVRPVLHINLSVSSVWKKAGTVTASSKLPATEKASATKKPAATKKPSVGKKEVIKGKAPKFTVKYVKKGNYGSYNLINVKIKLPKKAAGYQIRYKYPKQKTWHTYTVTRPKKNVYTINTYQKGIHKIQVRYYTKNKASYSKWSKTKNFKVKKIYVPKASETYKDDGVG